MKKKKTGSHVVVPPNVSLLQILPLLPDPERATTEEIEEAIAKVVTMPAKLASIAELGAPDPRFEDVDDFIDRIGADPYAQWMFMHFRLPAWQQAAWSKFIAGRRLFCDFEGQRYRVTGASRLGDIWLATDFNRDVGYDLRVDINACSAWGPEP